MRKFIIAIFFACLSILLFGCSTIGLTAYTAADDEYIHYDNRSGMYANINYGQEVTVITNEWRTISGEFIGLSQIPYEKYKKEYNSVKMSLDSLLILPEPGVKVQFISVINSFGSTERSIISDNKYPRFYAFDIGNIVLLDSMSNTVLKIPINLLKNCYFDSIKSVETKKIYSILATGKVPFLSKFNIRTNGEVISIPGEKVSEITIHNSKISESIFLIAGLSLDIYMLAVAGDMLIFPILGNIILFPIFLLSYL